MPANSTAKELFDTALDAEWVHISTAEELDNAVASGVVVWPNPKVEDHVNAFFVPGHGWYGGLLQALARRIVTDHNQMLYLRRQRDAEILADAEHGLVTMSEVTDQVHRSNCDKANPCSCRRFPEG